MSVPSRNPMVCQIPSLVSRHAVLQSKVVIICGVLYDDAKKTGIRGITPAKRQCGQGAAIAIDRIGKESELPWGDVMSSDGPETRCTRTCSATFGMDLVGNTNRVMPIQAYTTA